MGILDIYFSFYYFYKTVNNDQKWISMSVFFMLFYIRRESILHSPLIESLT